MTIKDVELLEKLAETKGILSTMKGELIRDKRIVVVQKDEVVTLLDTFLNMIAELSEYIKGEHDG